MVNNNTGASYGTKEQKITEIQQAIRYKGCMTKTSVKSGIRVSTYW